MLDEPRSNANSHPSGAILPPRPGHSILQYNVAGADFIEAEVSDGEIVNSRVDLDQRKVDLVLIERARGKTSAETAEEDMVSSRSWKLRRENSWLT